MYAVRAATKSILSFMYVMLFGLIGSIQIVIYILATRDHLGQSNDLRTVQYAHACIKHWFENVI